MICFNTFFYMMKIVATVIVIFFVQCVHSDADPGFREMFGPSCMYGPKTMSMNLYTPAKPEGKNIGVQQCCNKTDPTKPVIFMIHGFLSSPNKSVNCYLTQEMVKRDYIVLAVNWSRAACGEGIPVLKFLEYRYAVQNTHEIGRYVANYMSKLTQDCGVPSKNMTCIGHSLGAHVCGFAAKEMKKSKHGLIERIVAFDPASPMFSTNECPERLCKTDAKNVIAFKTSILGMPIVGANNFQFGNGKTQPSCSFYNQECAHAASMKYVAEAMASPNCAFPAVPMSSNPIYPGPKTTNCMTVDENTLLKRDYRKKEKEMVPKDYYVFVKPKSPHCTQETFNCKL